MGINEIVQIGTKIKNARIKQNIRQKDMAEALGIPASTYANYEANRREPDMETILNIADILNVSIEYLITSNIPDYDDYKKNIRLVEEASKEQDLKKLEQALGVPSGTILYVGPDAPFDFSEEKLQEERTKRPKGTEAFLIAAYNKLNPKGKREAIKRINELSQLPQYQRNND